MPHFASGAQILYRGVHIDECGLGGPPVVCDVKPMIVVEDTPARLALWMPAGTPTLLCVPNDRDQPKPWRPGEWQLVEDASWRWDALFVLEPGAWWATWLLWMPDGAFRGWYVNLQEPFERTPLGFDHRDLQLDIVVAPDGAWRWKDIDDLDRCEQLGVISSAIAARTRAEGDLAAALIASRGDPFAEAAQTWRPDAAWPRPTLPGGDTTQLAAGTFAAYG